MICLGTYRRFYATKYNSDRKLDGAGAIIEIPRGRQNNRAGRFKEALAASIVISSFAHPI